MASRNVMIGTGAALAGLGGLGVAALTASGPDAGPATAKADAQPVVQTQTVVVRKVEHRVVRAKARRRRAEHGVAVTTSAPASAAAVAAAPAPVLQQAAPSAAAPAPSTHPIRTRTSGSGSSGTAGEHEHNGHDDAAEHADD